MTVKYKMTVKIILVPNFCPLKPEIARFFIGFRLNSSSITCFAVGFMTSVRNLFSKINEMLLISRTFCSKSKHSRGKTCLKIEFKRVKLMLNYKRQRLINPGYK